MSSLDLFLPLAKVDLDQRLVTGVATAETPDRSGEICDYASSKPYFEKWSAEALAASGGKSLGAVRAMHGSIAAGKLTDIDFDDEGKRIVVAAKIVDDDEWRKVTEGVYTGFSQGGRYVKRWPDPGLEPRPLHRRAARNLARRPALPARRDLRGGEGRRGREARLRASRGHRRRRRRRPAAAATRRDAPAAASHETSEAFFKAAGELAEAAIELERAEEENARLRKALDDVSPALADLAKRVAALEAQPLPAKAALRAVAKSADGAAEAFGADEAVRRLAALPARGARARADQAQPRQSAAALLSSEPAIPEHPTRSPTPRRPAARRPEAFTRAIALLTAAIGSTARRSGRRAKSVSSDQRRLNLRRAKPGTLMNIAQSTEETLRPDEGGFDNRSPRPSRCRPAFPPTTCRRRRRTSIRSSRRCGIRCRASPASIPATPRAGAPSPRSSGSGYDAMGWVPEGQRTASMSYSAQAPGRALSDARRGRHGDLRGRSRRAGLRRPQRHRDAAPPAEDDAQGGDGAARRQRVPRARHARGADLSAPRARARPAGRHLFGDRRRAELRRLPELERLRRRRHHEDHHRQRRQHLYAERRLLDAQRQRHPGGDARPDAERDRRRSSPAPSPTPGMSARPARKPCRRSPPSTARPSARR